MAAKTGGKMGRLKIENLKKTCHACPAQWEGFLNDGRAIYIRYRWGYLSVCISPKVTGDISDAVNGYEIFHKQFGGEYHAELEESELQEITEEVLEFPILVLPL
jgi:hypothetical protein